MFVYQGWYSLTTETRGGPSFWAAWWTGEPCSSPWRTPDASGVGGQPEAFLAAEAQRRIRAVKGQGALVRELDATWARAAQREAAGQAPRHQPPPPARKPRSEFRRNARPKESARQQAESVRQQANAWAGMDRELRERVEELLREAARRQAQACAPKAARAADAFAVLGLPSTASAEEIGRAYRRKVATDRIHPDQGGDAATFRALSAARDRALAYVDGGASGGIV